jgi:hypothetical protein
MALPNGRMLLEPPRKIFQTVSANCVAWESDAKLTAPVAPPILIVTIFPFAWHARISDARKEQSSSPVPWNTGSLLVSHI